MSDSIISRKIVKGGGRWYANRTRMANQLLIAVTWAGYISGVTLVAQLSDAPEIKHTKRFEHLLQGFIEDGSEMPPLARWDSVWYYAISRDGYSLVAPNSHRTPGFFPLYPLLMRLYSEMSGGSLLSSGLWVSRLALLGALAIFMLYLETIGGAVNRPWLAIAALLAFPSSFLLVSVYSESLFLFLTLGTFYSSYRNRPGISAVLALLASLTRIHGLALVPALGYLGWQKWRLDRRWWHALPSIAAATGIVLYFGYLWWEFGDFLLYEKAKMTFGTGRRPPLELALSQWYRLKQAYHYGGFKSVVIFFDYLSALAALWSVHRMWAIARRPEALFVGGVLGLSLLGGSFWGFPRFTLFLFPLFALCALPSTKKLKTIVCIVLLGISALTQVGFIDFFVHSFPPSP